MPLIPNLKRPHSPSPSQPNELTDPTESTIPAYFLSQRITDRSSVFLGIYSPTPSATPLSPASQIALRSYLRKLPHLEGCTHRILAWRFASAQSVLSRPSTSPTTTTTTTATASTPPPPQRGTYDKGTDDDGEKYGAKHILRVLEEEDLTGVIIVGRWYGGIMLGPVRFRHIAGCAGGAVEACRAREGERIGEGQGAVKRARLGDEVGGEGVGEGEDSKEEAEVLRKQLRKRDDSVDALRVLLARKKAGSAGSSGTAAVDEEMKVSGVKAGEDKYEGLELKRLRQLDKQRDATIGFLLRQIRAVESLGGREQHKDGEGADNGLVGP